MVEDSVTSSINTPFHILCKANIENALSAHTRVISTLARENNLTVRLFLSVKTQPAPVVLQAAREKGFFAECISLAEVYVCLENGFKAEEIILTGSTISFSN
jgi:diaminopimelate decarboxylase